MLQLTHRTHIIAMLVLASISSGLSRDLSQPPPPLTDLSTTTTITTANISTTTASSATTIPIAAASTSATLSINTTATSSPATSTSTARASRPRRDEGSVCKGVHIRNDLKSFEQLKNCRIIDGPLTIALVSNVNSTKDYDNITFPLLTEITEYLLLFRVQNLTTLSKLFPNLSVIRGRELVSNYALIIYEMMQLQEIGLSSLTDILRGGVRIESNPNLCYIATVQWASICRHTYDDHFIKDNSIQCNNRCPERCKPWSNTTKLDIAGDKELGAIITDSRFCWNNLDCHESCPLNNSLLMAEDGGCCHPMCAGGCYESDRDDQCYACRIVSQDNRCVSQCRNDLFEYKGQCLNETDCANKTIELQSSQCDKGQEVSNYKPIRINASQPGTCQEYCPRNYTEDPEMKYKCKKCDIGGCRKICPQRGVDKPFVVTDIDSLKELNGCHVINGSLELTLKGGKNVLHELEEVFHELEEIDGYLKITRSYPIVTLGFLRNLKLIRGSTLDREYALVIVDNPNLQELFVHNQSATSNQKQLEIRGGKIFVHLNPKLCPHRIDSLKEYAIVPPWDERDVSQHTNGDKEACNTLKLIVEYRLGAAYTAKIGIENFLPKLEDPRVLLYYLINYREVPGNGTVTMFDGRDGCNSQNDVWSTQEEAPRRNVGNFQEAYISVKPATRYALYVKTLTILAGSQGALSDIIYFETAPDTPGMPKELRGEAKSPSDIELILLPPTKPNGIIERYFVTITRVADNEELQLLDLCNSIESRDRVSQVLDQGAAKKTSHMIPTTPNGGGDSLAGNSSSAQGDTCSRNKVAPDIKLQQVTFQDTIIDIVYLKQPCRTPKTSPKTVKRKRSIEHELNTTDSPSENSLPRKLTTASDQTSSAGAAVAAAAPLNTSIELILDTANTTVSSKIHDPLSIMYNSSNLKTEAYIAANKSNADAEVRRTITGLEHFSLYRIEVVACHGNTRTDKMFVPSSYKKCSLEAVTQVRTKAIPDNDKIDKSTIKFNSGNETISNILTWEPPPNPNGLVLAYRVRTRVKDGIWNTFCVNLSRYKEHQGFVFDDKSQGVYSVQVQTMSMYTRSDNIWSEEIEIEIERSLPPETVILIVFFSLILVAGGVASGAYCFHKNANDDLVYASVNPDYVQYDPDEWEVDKAKLIVGPQIGTGSFGMVYKGQLVTEKGKRDCAVKTVPPTSTAKQRMDFLREASIMKQFDTFHVVKLLGVVSITTPVYVIMEYMENGDLKDFLRNQREMHDKQNKTLVDGIYLMAAQIADGMAYLASRKFVHRDLAARNCMVGENRVIKIGDFGLTRDIYANDYYRRDTQGRLPVRWMAPESLSDNIYTSASDAWSYGIVLWEMVTFSAYPYQGLSNDEVIKRVIQGYTMPRPEHCPDKLYNIMDRCWRKNDKDRPAFLDIVEYLLPETDGKLYPNCFYRKPKVEGDSIAVSMPDDSPHNGTESYPLLSWPTPNNHLLTNGGRVGGGGGGGGVGENHISRE